MLSSAEIEKSCVYKKECWNPLEEKVHSCFLNFLSLFIFVIFPRFTFFSSSKECFRIRCNININWNDNGCLKSIRTGPSFTQLFTNMFFISFLVQKNFIVKNIFMICACKNCLIHQGKNKICFAVTFDNCYQQRLNSLLKK